jgi:type I restriction-modification system DNA methylase subunit
VLNDEGDFMGFDVVIGNPPYGVNFDTSEKLYIKTNYYSVEGDFDSYIYFLERSFALLKDSSKLAFIVPNNLLLQNYSKKIRELILKEFSIEYIIDLGLGVFDEAVVPTTIIILNKKLINNHIVKFLFRPLELSSNYQTINQDTFNSNENYAFNIQTNEQERNILDKIKNTGAQLNSICEIKIGIECIPKYITEEPISEFSKPLVRGRNFTKYLLKFEDDPKYVEYKRELLHRAREERLFICPRKILIRQTGDSIIATIDEKQLYAWKSVFVLLSNEDIFHLNYILAIINSKLINFFYQKLVGEEGRTFAQVKGVNLALIPMKLISIEEQKELIEKVNLILEMKNENIDTTSLESEIDQLVYQLYGLTAEEIKIVEGK